MKLNSQNQNPKDYRAQQADCKPESGLQKQMNCGVHIKCTKGLYIIETEGPQIILPNTGLLYKQLEINCKLQMKQIPASSAAVICPPTDVQ